MESGRGTLYSESLLRGELFLFCPVSSVDRRMQLDLCETILKKNVSYVAVFS